MKLTVKTILVGGFLGLLLISITTILVSSYVSSEKVLQKHARDIMENITTLTIQQSQNYLEPAHDAVELTQRLANSKVVSSKDRKSLERYFSEQLALHSQIAGIYMGKPDGEFIYVMKNDSKVPGGLRTKLITTDKEGRTTELIWRDSSHKELYREQDTKDTYDPRERLWYKKAIESGKLIWTDPYIFFTSQKPGITAASPVFLKSGEIKGIVGVDIEIHDISIFLSKLKVGKSGRAFIMSKKGDVIAFPDSEKIKHPIHKGSAKFRLTKITELDDVLSRRAFESASDFSNTMELNEPLFSTFIENGNRYHVMFSPFTDTQWPWIIGIYLPEDDYLGPIKDNRLYNIFLALGIMSIASIIGIFIAGSISKPMKALQSEAMAIKGYDLDTTFDKKSIIKEVQKTSDAFAQMKAGLEKYRHTNESITDDLMQQAVELRENEIKLRATFTSLVNFADALIVLDTGYIIRFTNPAAEALLKAKASSLKGQKFPYPVTKGVKTELSIPAHHDNVFIVEMLTVDTEWEGQNALLVSLRDISERKWAEESLSKSNRQLKSMVTRLKRREEELTAIGKMAEFFQVCTTESEILKVVSENMESLFPVDSGTFYMLNEENNSLSSAYSWGHTSDSKDSFTFEECWALKKGQPHKMLTDKSKLACEHIWNENAKDLNYLCIPVATSQKQLGMLYMQFTIVETDFSYDNNHNRIEQLLDLGRTVAEHIALAISNVRMQEALQEMAIQDHLTGLYNRRYMQDNLEHEIHRASRNKTPIGLILLDIDHFKSINDRYGHGVGDRVLTTLSILLKTHVRKGDICCRYGGEEFLIILPNSSYKDTFTLAEKLRLQVKELDISYDGHTVGDLTISAGVASYPEQANNYEGLIKAADNAMYRAKDKGRDHVS